MKTNWTFFNWTLQKKSLETKTYFSQVNLSFSKKYTQKSFLCEKNSTWTGTSLGAKKWFHYTVSINHPLGFKEGSPDGNLQSRQNRFPPQNRLAKLCASLKMGPKKPVISVGAHVTPLLSGWKKKQENPCIYRGYLCHSIWAMKKPWLFRVIRDYTTQLCGDYFSNHDIIRIDPY